MGLNSKQLKAFPMEKKPVKKDPEIIYGPNGQWDYPGSITRIPGGNITMAGVNYPVLGVDNNGNQQMMYPGMDYTFPTAQHVTEYPQIPKEKRGGSIGKTPRRLTNKNIQSSINPLFLRNQDLFGPGGRNLYKAQTGVTLPKSDATNYYTSDINDYNNHERRTNDSLTEFRYRYNALNNINEQPSSNIQRYNRQEARDAVYGDYGILSNVNNYLVAGTDNQNRNLINAVRRSGDLPIGRELIEGEIPIFKKPIRKNYLIPPVSEVTEQPKTSKTVNVPAVSRTSQTLNNSDNETAVFNRDTTKHNIPEAYYHKEPLKFPIANHRNELYYFIDKSGNRQELTPQEWDSQTPLGNYPVKKQGGSTGGWLDELQDGKEVKYSKELPGTYTPYNPSETVNQPKVQNPIDIADKQKVAYDLQEQARIDNENKVRQRIKAQQEFDLKNYPQNAKKLYDEDFLVNSDIKAKEYQDKINSGTEDMMFNYVMPEFLPVVAGLSTAEKFAKAIPKINDIKNPIYKLKSAESQVGIDPIHYNAVEHINNNSNDYYNFSSKKYDPNIIPSYTVNSKIGTNYTLPEGIDIDKLNEFARRTHVEGMIKPHQVNDVYESLLKLNPELKNVSSDVSKNDIIHAVASNLSPQDIKDLNYKPFSTNSKEWNQFTNSNKGFDFKFSPERQQEIMNLFNKTPELSEQKLYGLKDKVWTDDELNKYMQNSLGNKMGTQADIDITKNLPSNMKVGQLRQNDGLMRNFDDLFKGPNQSDSDFINRIYEGKGKYNPVTRRYESDINSDFHDKFTGYTDVPQINHRNNANAALLQYGKQPLEKTIGKPFIPNSDIMEAMDKDYPLYWNRNNVPYLLDTDFIPENLKNYSGKEAFQQLKPNKKGGQVNNWLDNL